MTSKSRVNGRVLVNGTTPSLDDFRKISSYVEQDDALIGSLTVEETLYFTAQLSLPKSVLLPFMGVNHGLLTVIKHDFFVAAHREDPGPSRVIWIAKTGVHDNRHSH